MSSYDATIRSADMDSATRKLLAAILPKVPLMARVVLMHSFSLTTPSRYLSLRSELIVAVLRSFLQPSVLKPISSTQKLTMRDPGIKGKMWVAKTSSPEIETIEADSINSVVRGAIDDMLEPGAPKPCQTGFRMPDIMPVEAEWTGFRSDASSDSVMPNIPEDEKFGKLMEETMTKTTILYFHGGAYYLLDPCTHRPHTARLARMTGGRVYSVRYRLSPQHPFPAALIDGLVSYLTLLYPPEGSLHDPVDPSNLAFAGDSAGGNLCLALLQLLLQLRQPAGSGEATIRWQGRDVPLPLPACVAVNSPWLDITQSSPSWEDPEIQLFDYLPPSSVAKDKAPPPCAAWPADPPREHIYSPDSVLAHPLVSLVMAKSWAGAPPVWMCTGWERLASEDRWFTRKLAGDGVQVRLEQYEAMPHCFAMVLGGIPEGKRCFEGWAGFISEHVVGKTGGGKRERMPEAQIKDDKSMSRSGSQGPDETAVPVPVPVPGETRFKTVKAKSLREVDIPTDELTTMSEDEMRERVWRRVCEMAPAMSREKGAKL
ncbi:Esterase [Zalerion maritima]|uniref:Esterase n=1 Tax=Zalerion maritima TaxID=339359 RepID=A0AAD5S305_9PEZI|nr:Esterase [Zalerion maritima]